MVVHLNKWAIPTIALLVILGLALILEHPDFRVSKGEEYVSVTDGNLLLMEYSYLGVPKKPYVRYLATPKGVNVLLDAPPDHKHHHGLMFAVGVNEADFWAEEQDSGRQEHRALEVVGTGFTHQVDWTFPGLAAPLLTEMRTLKVSITGSPPATLLTWRTQLKSTGTEAAAIWGRHYFGLGMRFVPSMDRVGSFINPTGEAGRLVRGEERLVVAPWCAYSGPAGGEQVTVAIFDHPANSRHPPPMFTMPADFAYLSATLDLWEKPMRIEPSAPLELSYGVAVWDGRLKETEIGDLYSSWVRSNPNR